MKPIDKLDAALTLIIPEREGQRTRNERLAWEAFNAVSDQLDSQTATIGELTRALTERNAQSAKLSAANQALTLRIDELIKERDRARAETRLAVAGGAGRE